jgi:hypothetical protein
LLKTLKGLYAPCSIEVEPYLLVSKTISSGGSSILMLKITFLLMFFENLGLAFGSG